MNSHLENKSLLTRLSSEGIEISHSTEGRFVTTISCGGLIDLLIRPNSVEEVQKSYSILSQYSDHVSLLGFGSNILISDQGVVIPTIQLGKGFRYTRKNPDTKNGVSISVGGATSLTTLSRELANAGLSGFEFAAGIPASVGGAVAMNAGAHGSDISAVLSSALIYSNETGLVSLSAQDLSFSYRSSRLPKGAIVMEATFALTESDKDTVQKLLQENLADRKKHQPLIYPSCGSVFKNPGAERGGAGSLIESVGLKGAKSGDVEISSMHANWIVNPTKKGSAQDVFTLIELAQNTVLTQCKVKLVPEVKLWGFSDVKGVVSNN
jgi:UDP-N-acetylmuramate dehydrogenase